MLKKSIIAAAILAMLLVVAQPASAKVRFGVTIGSPGYSYPYGYYPSYSYPAYPYPSAYPYVYRYPAYARYYVAPRSVSPYVYRYEYNRRYRHWRR